MLRGAAIFFAVGFNLAALPSGELRFQLGDRSYATTNALAAIEKKGANRRVTVAVKDIAQRFLFILTVDLPAGNELKPLELSTATDAVSLVLRTQQGSLAVLPQIQFAKPTDEMYSERVEVDTGELEDDPTVNTQRSSAHDTVKKRRRHKKRVEYRRVKPRWHTMSREEKLQTGEGVIRNGSFANTSFRVRLVPVVSQGKVVSYEGSFGGVGRFSNSVSGAHLKSIQGGVFNVQVQYAQ